jgi:hypothetical protein
MDEQTIGLIFAFIGIGATIVYITLGFMGINLLKEIRDRFNDREDHQNQ